MYTLGEISNIDVKEESVLRVRGEKKWKKNCGRSTRIKESDGRNFLVQTTQRAACQWLKETLRAEVGQGYTKAAGSQIIHSFSSLSHDRSKAPFKASSPYSAI
jgi:hypothetical protein